MHLWEELDKIRRVWWLQIKRQVFQSSDIDRRRRNASKRISDPAAALLSDPEGIVPETRRVNDGIGNGIIWGVTAALAKPSCLLLPQAGTERCRGAAETTSGASIHLALLEQNRIGRSALGWMGTSVRSPHPGKKRDAYYTLIRSPASCLLMIVVTEPDYPVPAACLSSCTIYSHHHAWVDHGCLWNCGGGYRQYMMTATQVLV